MLTCWLTNWVFGLLNDLLTDRLADLQSCTDWLNYLMTDLLTGWLTDRLTFWLAGWLTNRLTDLLTGGWLADWLTDLSAYQTYWPILLTDWLVQLLTDCVTDRRLDWLASSLTNWLEWLTEVLRFMLRKGSNFNTFMMWTKINAIADPDESDWCFISDQICLTDSSRLQQPGFWAYLQYCTCECCIHCFAI